MIVDTHPHVISPDTAAYPVAPVGGSRSSWSEGVSVTGADLAGWMAAAGVSRAVVVQTSTVYGADNSLLADTVAASPSVFGGICSVDPLAADAADRLAYWVTSRGLHGLRLFATSASAGEVFALDDPRLDPVFSRAAALSVPVDVQIRYGQLPALRRVLEAHPSVVVVLDHLASPASADAPELFALSAFPQLHLKFLNHNLLKLGDGFLSRLVSEFGADRLLWGSNYPNTFGRPVTYPELVREAVAAVSDFPPSVRDALLGGTAQRVYHL